MHFWALTVSHLTSCNVQTAHQRGALAVDDLMSVELLPFDANGQYSGSCDPTFLLQSSHDQASLFVCLADFLVPESSIGG